MFLPTEKGIFPPEGGWKPHTLYLVDVSFASNNPIHEAYFEVGFVNDDGSLGGYCEVWCNNYDNAYRPGKVFYMRPVRELHTRNS